MPIVDVHAHCFPRKGGITPERIEELFQRDAVALLGLVWLL